MSLDAMTIQGETFVVNMGPQHPATHGVLRLKLTMDGEYIMHAEPVIGYSHRMQEKMAENRTYSQYCPNTGRIDYAGAMLYNFGYACAVERLAGIPVPERAEYIRVITAELSRIASHLLWFGPFIIDLGGLTPLLYAFDDREIILDLLESVSGSRLTHSYFRFGGVCNDIDDDFIAGCRAFIPRMRERLVLYRRLVTDNVIFRKRVEGIGLISAGTLPEIRRHGSGAPRIGHRLRRPEKRALFDLSRVLDFDIPVFTDVRLPGPVSGPDGGDEPVPPDHRAGPGQAARPDRS